MAARTVMWFSWLVMAFVTGCYCALSLATFANIYRAEQAEESIEQVLCITAASFFGSALVFIYTFVSFCVILGKTISKSGAGFSYGFITSSSCHMGILCLLCGFVLQGSQASIRKALKETPASEYWRDLHDEVFLATFILAYVSSFVYGVFFLVLLCTKSGLRKCEKKPSNTESFSPHQGESLEDEEVEIRIDTRC